MIDLNNHILSLSHDEAYEEITKLLELDYKAVILTSPALSENSLDLDEVITRYNSLKLSCKQIPLFLGSEIHYHYSMLHRLEQKEVLSLNQSEYIFIKLPKEKKPEQLLQVISYLKDKKIVISCIEECKYFSIGDIKDLKEKGLYFFSNINNIKSSFLRKILKNGLVDFLGTYNEIKDFRGNSFLKKLDKNYYNKLLNQNYSSII